MEIRFLALSTAELAETGEFYRDVLQLPRLVEGNDHSIFRAGSTHLMFEAVQDSSRRPFYHFAFDIPRNQLSQAAEWLSRRVTLLERDGQTRLPFPVWRNYGSFKALGSETGLLLLVPVGRPWTPTARPAEAHPTGVVFTLREPHGESRLWRRFDRSRHRGGTNRSLNSPPAHSFSERSFDGTSRARLPADTSLSTPQCR